MFEEQIIELITQYEYNLIPVTYLNKVVCLKNFKYNPNFLKPKL